MVRRKSIFLWLFKGVLVEGRCQGRLGSFRVLLLLRNFPGSVCGVVLSLPLCLVVVCDCCQLCYQTQNVGPVLSDGSPCNLAY